MEVENILSGTYKEMSECIVKMTDTNVKRRQCLEKEIKQLDKDELFSASEEIAWRMKLEETMIDDLIEELQVLKIDIKYYRKLLVKQVKEHGKKIGGEKRYAE